MNNPLIAALVNQIKEGKSSLQKEDAIQNVIHYIEKVYDGTYTTEDKEELIKDMNSTN